MSEINERIRDGLKGQASRQSPRITHSPGKQRERPNQRNAEKGEPQGSLNSSINGFMQPKISINSTTNLRQRVKMLPEVGSVEDVDQVRPPPTLQLNPVTQLPKISTDPLKLNQLKEPNANQDEVIITSAGRQSEYQDSGAQLPTHNPSQIIVLQQQVRMPRQSSTSSQQVVERKHLKHQMENSTLMQGMSQSNQRPSYIQITADNRSPPPPKHYGGGHSYFSPTAVNQSIRPLDSTISITGINPEARFSFIQGPSGALLQSRLVNAQKSSDDLIADIGGLSKRRIPSPAPAMRMVGFQNRLVKLKPELAMNAEAEIPQLLDVNNLQPSQIDDSDQLIYGDEEEEEDDDDSQSASAISYSNQDINGNDGDDCALSRGGNQLLNNGGGGSAVGTPTSNAQLKLQSNRSHQIKALNSSPQANSPNGLNIGGNQEGRLQTGSFQHQTSNVSSSNSYATQNQGNPGQVGRSTFAQKRRSLSKQPRQLSKNSGQNGSPQVPQNQIRVLQPSPPTDPVTQTTNPVQNRRLLSVSHNQSGQFKFGSDIGRIPRLSGLKVAQNANGQSELLSSFVSKNEESQEQEDYPRYDKFGNQIIPGKKGHRITFMDEFYPNRNIARVVIVESYKKFNHASYDENNEQFCHCAMF